MAETISGILTPNITPVDQAGRIDEQTLRGYVDWLIEHGVDGLYPNGSTGEFVRFTAEERRRIVQIVVDQTAGRVPILAGAAEANAKERSARLAQVGSGDRSEKIRTYNYKDNRTTDHRLGRNFSLEPVLQGQLAELIGACVSADQRRQLEQLAEQAAGAA